MIHYTTLQMPTNICKVDKEGTVLVGNLSRINHFLINKLIFFTNHLKKIRYQPIIHYLPIFSAKAEYKTRDYAIAISLICLSANKS